MPSPELIDERFEELVRELRATTPAAPPALRARVRGLGEAPAPVPAPRRRLPIGRLALVGVPAAAISAAGIALAVGLFLGGGTSTRTVEQGAVASGAAKSRATATVPERQLAPVPVQGGGGATSPPLPPSGGRLQQYGASLRLRVRNLDALSAATQRAVRIARGLGGYVVSADYGAPGDRQGDATLVLRVPVAHVQQAIVRLEALGVLLAQEVRLQDLQGTVNALDDRIAVLRREIVAGERALRGPSLSPEARTRIQAQLALDRRALAGALQLRAATTRRGRLARIELALTTRSAVAPPKPHNPGRLDRALDDAGAILAREGQIAIYALVVLGPLALLLGAAVLSARVLRRRGQERLLERS